MQRASLLVAASALLVAACASLVGFPDVPNAEDADAGSSDHSASGADVLTAANDAFEAADSGTASSSGGSDSSTMDDACGAGGCGDASCPLHEMLCGTTCVNLTTSGTNCGQCGHDCKGATCVDSACQPQPLVTGIDAPTGFAIDGTSIYFVVDDVLKKCALDGCSTGTTQLANYPSMYSVEVVNGNVTFAATPTVGNHPPPSLFSCPTSGCGATPATIHQAPYTGVYLQFVVVGADLYFLVQYVPGNQASSSLLRCVSVSGTGTGCSNLIQIGSFEATTPIAADDSSVYFTSTQEDSGVTLGIDSCSNAGACSAPRGVNGNDPSQMVSYGGKLFFTAGRDIDTGGSLYSCPVTGGSAATSLDNVSMSATSLAADSSGIYFASAQDIYHCPLAGCGVAGPVPIATGSSSPAFIRTDADFVYWVDLGADGGVGGAAIYRVKK